VEWSYTFPVFIWNVYTLFLYNTPSIQPLLHPIRIYKLQSWQQNARARRDWALTTLLEHFPITLIQPEIPNLTEHLPLAL
jgi:hypothetical protein